MGTFSYEKVNILNFLCKKGTSYYIFTKSHELILQYLYEKVTNPYFFNMNCHCFAKRFLFSKKKTLIVTFFIQKVKIRNCSYTNEVNSTFCTKQLRSLLFLTKKLRRWLISSQQQNTNLMWRKREKEAFINNSYTKYLSDAMRYPIQISKAYQIPKRFSIAKMLQRIPCPKSKSH